jgi:hypothetical protein
MPKNSTILLGLNKSSSFEASSLRKYGNKIVYIGPGKNADEITLKTKTYKLDTRKGVDDFVLTLGLSSAQSKKIADAIYSAEIDIKDELARLASVLAEMEKNRTGPNRIIISGHSVGSNSFWGDDNGFLEFKDIKKLIAAMPVAANMIEDLHLSACYSGSKQDLSEWLNVFPKLTTIWAYDGSAPGSYSGAVAHLSRWDKATRGSVLELNRLVAEKTRKGENVAVWSKKNGYQSKASQGLPDLLQRVQNAEPVYQSYFLGDQTVVNTQTGALREYYNDLQSLVGHSLSTASQRATYGERIQITIRLIYFDKKIKAKFSSHYAEAIKKGYNSLSKSAPNFSKLSRKACLQEIDNYVSELAKQSSASIEATKLKDLLVEGLKGLDPKHIPTNWI